MVEKESSAGEGVGAQHVLVTVGEHRSTAHSLVCLIYFSILIT